MKVESLDELFDEQSDNGKKEEKSELKEKGKEKVAASVPTNSLDDMFEDIETPKAGNKIQEEPEDTYDLQKELEAKFDELFGPIDDE